MEVELCMVCSLSVQASLALFRTENARTLPATYRSGIGTE